MITFVKNKNTRNSSQRRSNNLRRLADGGRVRVAYNGSVVSDILLPTHNGVYLFEGRAILAKDYVYAVDVKNRFVTLRLRDTRGLIQ